MRPSEDVGNLGDMAVRDPRVTALLIVAGGMSFTVLGGILALVIVFPELFEPEARGWIPEDGPSLAFSAVQFLAFGAVVGVGVAIARRFRRGR
ncbi:MAG: hypothetical protein AAFZ18_31325 [Myxococcota bacterium]